MVKYPNLRDVQIQTLELILKRPGINSYQVESQTNDTNSTLRRLEKRGLVENKPDVKNGRVVRCHWYLTAEGKEAVRERRQMAKRV